jgi:hypothetical protein
MPSAAHTFVSTRDERIVLRRLKAFLPALGRLALAERMNAARVEIERGGERLWLQPDHPPIKKRA